MVAGPSTLAVTVRIFRNLETTSFQDIQLGKLPYKDNTKKIKHFSVHFT